MGVLIASAIQQHNNISARCSQTRVRPPRDSARVRHGRALSAARAFDRPRPAGPWYGRVEHYTVLRIPTYDNLETPPPA